MPKIILHCSRGSSDKIYEVEVATSGTGHVVNVANGRRGSALRRGTKTPEPVPLEQAQAIAARLVKAKVSKGYRIICSEGPVEASPMAEIAARPHSGVFCQLLNPVDESGLETLLTDEGWCLQVKEDGVRQLLLYREGTVSGINRKGEFVDLDPVIAAAVKSLPCRGALIDSEALGGRNVAFDLLEIDGICLRRHSYGARLSRLKRLLEKEASPIGLVETAQGSVNKRALFARVQACGGEGVVAKRLVAAYTEGRPNSGGDQLKFKFYATASVLVTGHDARGKRSVEVSVLDESDQVPVGKVTIPPNHDVPAVGAVVEVRYLYWFKDGCLFQPTYLGERCDISRAECLLGQLKAKQAA